MSGCMIGWAHTKFGKLEDRPDVESLLSDVVAAAIKDADLAAEDIDAVFVGLYNNGFSDQDFPSSLVIQAEGDLLYKPITRVENACATGSAAVQQALTYVKANPGSVALAVGAEKMTSTPGPKIGDILLTASYRKEEAGIDAGFAGVFGQIARSYYQKHGDQSDTLARIAAKNHANGCANQYAQFQKDLGFEFCNTVSDKNPEVAPPLRRTDCSLVSDGAAAVVITDLDRGMKSKKAVAFRGTSHVNDYLPISRREITEFPAARKAWKDALDNAGATLDDLDLVETHDCFTIAELIEYEAMGLTETGKGRQAIDEGWVMKDGKLPVNASGGLKSKGHPIGATGVSMHALVAMQLAGEAGDMQIPDASMGGIFNMGGASVANYVSVLERLR